MKYYAIVVKRYAIVVKYKYYASRQILCYSCYSSSRQLVVSIIKYYAIVVKYHAIVVKYHVIVVKYYAIVLCYSRQVFVK